MESLQLEFDLHPFLNKEANDYLKDEDALKPFRDFAPGLDNVPEVIEGRKDFPPALRETLAKELHRQYDGIGVTGDHAIRQQINSLTKPDTFTVTTGQQLHLGLGPLFFIYKILSCIDVADELRQRFPQYHFVPLFWMASEDHDFEEINYVKLYGQNYTWDDFQDGPVGRYSTKSILPVIRAIRDRIDQTPMNLQMLDMMEDAYSRHQTLSAATQALIHNLLGHRGLLVLDPDENLLKNGFREVVKNDVLEGINYQPLDEYSRRLKENGYDLQINPQEINHFLLHDGKRLKIRKAGENFVTDSGWTINKSEMERLIETNIGDFSPNVVMRPLYQETILPNIIYIPGGSELRYWLQLKGVFQANHIPYPMVLPRSSAVVISDRTAEQIEHLGGAISQLFKSEDELAEGWGNNDQSPVQTLRAKMLETKAYFKELPPDLQRLTPQDAPPLKHVGSVVKSLDAILQWIDGLPPEIKRDDAAFTKLIKIKRRFFDNSFPQERMDYCIENLPFIHKLCYDKMSYGMFKDCRKIYVFVTKSV